MPATMIPLKHVASINAETLLESTDPGFEFSYIDISSVSLRGGVEATQRVTFGDAPSRARRVVRAGDVLVSTVRTYLKAIAPAEVNHDGMIASTGFAVVRPRTVLPSFLRWALTSETFIDEVIRRSTGVSYPAIAPTDMASIMIPVPTLDGQAAIASFLQDQTRRIDETIEQRRRSLTLADEMLRAEIDGYLAERPGAVPQRLRLVSNHAAGVHIAPDLLNTEGRGIRYLRTGDIYERSALDKEPVWFDGDIAGMPIAKATDVIACLDGFVRDGDTGTLGYATFGVEGIIGPNLVLPSSRGNIEATIIAAAHLASCFRDKIILHAEGSTVKHGARGLRHVQFWIPEGRAAQKDVARSITSAMTATARLKVEIRHSTTLLDAYRSSLISAAVNNEIDVTSFNPPALVA